MKKTLFLLAICLFVSMTTQAQFDRAIRNAVRKSVEKKVEKQVEKKVIESIEKDSEDQNEGSSENKNRASSIDEAISNRILSNMSNVKYDESYSYSSKISIYIENTDAEGNVSSGHFNTYFNPETKNYAMEVVDNESAAEDDPGLIVYDRKNAVMLILGSEDDEKSGFAMNVTVDSTSTETETEELTDEQLDLLNPYYKATGRTKKILGKNCREYTGMTNDSCDVQMWVTRDIKCDYSNTYKYMGLSALSGYSYGGSLWGTTLETHITDSKNGTRSDMYVREINADTDKTINLKGYQIIGFGGKKE